MEKLKNQFTINLNDDDAQTLAALAREHQRKPAELLRLLVVPQIKKEWIKLQKEEHQENQTPPTLARFTPSQF